MIDRYVLHLGDCLDILPTLPAASVQCVVTSPPYYGLRDYGHEAQIGLEQTPEEYVDKLVAVFCEVRRVLRDDGTVFLNLGDSYAANRGYQVVDNKHCDVGNNHGSKVPANLKPKDLIGIPWRVAFALQADGWYLRQDIIWHKPNPMPESVTDRCTKAHEYIFLLSKSPRYYYDAKAIAEISKYAGEQAGICRGTKRRAVAMGREPSGNEKPGSDWIQPETRNRRSVWTIATQPYSGAHFATMPPALAEVCIKAGTSERGCCPACGAPWERVTLKNIKPPPDRINNNSFEHDAMTTHGEGATTLRNIVNIDTIGWQPTCACDAGEPVPCVVLDPFMGSGTTGQVAAHLGQSFVGIELNAEYLELARQRVGNPYDDFVMTDKERTSGQLPLFGQRDD